MNYFILIHNDQRYIFTTNQAQFSLMFEFRPIFVSKSRHRGQRNLKKWGSREVTLDLKRQPQRTCSFYYQLWNHSCEPSWQSTDLVTYSLSLYRTSITWVYVIFLLFLLHAIFFLHILLFSVQIGNGMCCSVFIFFGLLNFVRFNLV